jgi:hypothetical protein
MTPIDIFNYMRRLRKVSPFFKECLEKVDNKTREIVRRHMDIQSEIMTAQFGDKFLTKDGTELTFIGIDDSNSDDDATAIFTHTEYCPDENHKKIHVESYYLDGVRILSVDEDGSTIVSKIETVPINLKTSVQSAPGAYYKEGYEKAIENAIKILVDSETFHSTGSRAALAFRNAVLNKMTN